MPQKICFSKNFALLCLDQISGLALYQIQGNLIHLVFETLEKDLQYSVNATMLTLRHEGERGVYIH